MKNPASKLGLISALAISAASFVQTASAENMGYFQFSVTGGSAENPSGSDVSIQHKSLSGAFLYDVNENVDIILNAQRNTNTFDDYGILYGSIHEGNYAFSAHGLYSINNGLKLGGFFGLNNTNNDDDGYSYRALFGGVEAHYSFNDNTGVYMQAGVVSQRDDEGTGSMGFDDGEFIRLGAFHAFNWGGVVSLDIERAKSDFYEDDDEPGDLWSYGLTYEHDLNAIENGTVVAGVRKAQFDAVGDGDLVNETSYFLGFKFGFGGGAAAQKRAGMIGDPYTIIKADTYVPGMD